MTAWVLLLCLRAPVEPTIAVQVQGTPPAKCQFQARLSRALTDLGHPLWARPELRVTAAFETGQTVLRIERNGSRVLERKLGLLGCPELVETSALIVDRFVNEVGWSGTTSMSAAEAPRTPTPEVPAARVDAEPASDAGSGPVAVEKSGEPDASPPAPPEAASPDAGLPIADTPSPGLAFDADLAAGGVVTNAGLFPAFAAELALHRGLWRVGLLGEAPLLPGQNVIIQNRNLGAITPWQLHLLAAGGLQTRWWRARLSGQLAAGVLLTGVTPRGTFNRRQSGLGALPELGAVLRGVVQAAFGIEVGLLIKALFPLGSNTFDVEGTTAAFRTSPFSVWAGVEFGWSSAGVE